MLYITSRDNKDAHTAYKTLVQNLGEDGGRYLPFRLPAYTPEEIAGFGNRTFGESVAEILNLFFSAKLTGWDVDFCIGRTPQRLACIGRKIVIAQLWHTPAQDYAYLVKSLYARVLGKESADNTPTAWFCAAVRIAVLFGIYGEMLRTNILNAGQTFDVAVQGGDFSEPVAVWVAVCMGLPVRLTVCGCVDDSAAWDLIHRGEMNTAAASEELRLGVECFLAAVCGKEEALQYKAACDKRSLYTVNPELPFSLNDRVFCAVVGKERISAVINSVYRTNQFVMDPESAVPYGALQDYRAKAGESVLTVILAQRTPMAFKRAVEAATGLSQEQLTQLCKPV